MRGVKHFFTQTAFFTFLQVLPPLAGFVMIKLYSNYLTEAEFSIYNLVNLYTNLVFVFISFGSDQLVLRFYYEFRDNKSKLNEFYGTIFSGFLILTVLFFLLFLPFHTIINNGIFNGSLHNQHLILGIVILNALNLAFIRLIQSILRVERDNRKNLIFSVLVFVFQVAGSTAGLFAMDDRILGTFTGRFAGIAMVVLFLFLWSGTRYQLKFRPGMLLPQWSFFIPVILYNFFYWLSTYSDQFVFNFLTPQKEQLALYQMAFNLTILVDMVLTAVNAHMSPEFNELMKSRKEGYIENIRTNAHLLIVLSISGMIGILFFGQVVLDFVIDPKYRDGAVFLGVLTGIYIFRLLYLIFAIPIYFFRKTYYLPAVFLVSGLLNIGLNMLLIPVLGIWSLVACSAASKFIQTITIALISRRIFPIPYNWHKIIFLPLLYLVLVATATLAGTFYGINFYIVWLVPSLLTLLFMYFIYKKQIIQLYHSIIVRFGNLST